MKIVNCLYYSEVTGVQLLQSYLVTTVRQQEVQFWRLQFPKGYIRVVLVGILSVCVPLTSAHRRTRLAWWRYRTLNRNSMGVRASHGWVLVQPKYRFSMNIHLDRTREPLPTLKRQSNRPLWQRRFGGLGNMLDGLTPLHVFGRGSVTSVMHGDEIFEPYVCFSGVQFSPISL